MTENAAAELERLNALREKAVEPFAKFRGKLKDNDGEGCAKAVFELLCELDTAQRLKDLAIYLETRAKMCSLLRRSGSGTPYALCSMSRRRRSARPR